MENHFYSTPEQQAELAKRGVRTGLPLTNGPGDFPDDTMGVICPRPDELSIVPVDGSVLVHCVECNTEVWAAPSTVKLIAEGAEPYCFACAGIDPREAYRQAFGRG